MSLIHIEARFGFEAAAVFLVLVVLLHFIRRDLEPFAHMISEYACGRHGWLMRLAFYFLAASCLALASAMFTYRMTATDGPLVLAIAAIGAAGAGFFVTDTPDAREVSAIPSTRDGMLHVVFSFIFIPLFPVAAVLSLPVLMNGVVAHSERVILFAITAFTWIGLLGFVGSPLYVAVQNRGRGADAPVGILQRIMVLSYALWLLTAAWIITSMPQ